MKLDADEKELLESAERSEWTRDRRVTDARTARLMPVLLVLAVSAAGAASFWWAFDHQLRSLPPSAYECRDDAVITLSHARNLVEFGFIGVSPSGERVEGFSAPLQFWVATAAYALTKVDYQGFCRVQGEAGTLLLGLACAWLLLAGTGQVNRTCLWRLAFIGVAICATAEILARSRAFLLWHASGMENVYKNVALLLLLWALDAMLRTGRIRPALGALVFAASIARTEAVVPVTILLAAFVGAWRLRHGDWRAVGFVVIGLAPWVAYMFWRWTYFGQWVPNTAVAQWISVDARLAALWESPGATLRDYYRWSTDVGGSLLAAQLVWLPVVAVLLRRHRTALERAAFMAVGAFGCVVQYALFGPARMDPARTVSELALFSTLLVPFVLLGKSDFRLRDFAVGLALLSGSVAYAEWRPPDRAEVGWAASWFESTVARAAEIAREHDIPRPTLSNPDLGAVSWHKQFNLIDLGKLGSSVTSRLLSPVRYIAEIAKPDIIEIHDHWSCVYPDLFSNPHFIEEYLPVSAERTPWLNAICGHAPLARSGYWVRRAVLATSSSRERKFLDAFARQLDVATVRAELDQCLAGEGRRPCDYVGRTLFRFVPELKQKGLYREVAALLAADQRLVLERAYFTSSTDPLWWRRPLARADPIRQPWE